MNSNYTAMKILSLVLLTAVSLSACSQNQSQQKKINTSCEGCEAINESPVSFDKLRAIDTLPGFNEPGPKLNVNGVVYKKDGKTPAADVVLYLYQTDQKGIYTPGENAKGWEKRHGYRRAWIKTNKKGEYQFFTLVPASYPGTTNPKHIHVILSEPDGNTYWIDEYTFKTDPYFVAPRAGHKPRGGSGILNPEMKNGILEAKRDIVLE